MMQLNSDLLALKSRAEQACAFAHAPYSRFPVGAAVTDASGQIASGCNVENASFGLTMCAERNAIAAALAAGYKDLNAVVIYTPGKHAHAPCGACRQVMQELLNPEASIISCCDSDEVKNWTLVEILPDPFITEKCLGA